MDKIMESYANLLMQKRYSPNTQKTYLGYFSDFCENFPFKDINYISKNEIDHYILDLIRTKNISPSPLQKYQ